MRTVSAQDAVAGIGSGNQVYLHCAAATPSVLLDAHGFCSLGVSVEAMHAVEPRAVWARAKGPNGPCVARACQGTLETADLRHRASRLAAGDRGL